MHEIDYEQPFHHNIRFNYIKHLNVAIELPSWFFTDPLYDYSGELYLNCNEKDVETLLSLRKWYMVYNVSDKKIPFSDNDIENTNKDTYVEKNMPPLN